MAELKCWNCGADLRDIPRPISRHANCPECFNEVHCCRMCVHFDSTITAGQCDEDRADPPLVKEGANFCEWFRPNLRAYDPAVTRKAEDAQARLDALFADDEEQVSKSASAATKKSAAGTLSSEDAAKAALDRLFSTPKSAAGNGPPDDAEK